MKTLCRDGATLHQHFNLIRSTRLRGTTTSRVHPHPAQVPAVEEKPAAAQVPAVEEKPAAAQVPAVEEKPAAAQVPAVEEKPAAAQVPAVEEKPAQVQNSVKAPSASVQPHAEGTYLDCATEEHTHTHIHHAKRKRYTHSYTSTESVCGMKLIAVLFSLQMWKLSEKVPGRTGRGQKISPGVLVQIGPLHTITNTTHLCTPLNMYINSYSIKALKPYNNR
ncbi:uncharacterized protein LOC124379752 isoform X2 [Silurus meridionalis]|uniref:uncharacterized protein LOC124379752 isoform X2 n=1 Tax=Silurus meridionalis TaxID=175797 RepID=UPI001EE9FE80|nr:uncharacterized protein LOC124379752 isoform X2 [Silurus meridionalis]